MNPIMTALRLPTAAFLSMLGLAAVAAPVAEVTDDFKPELKLRDVEASVADVGGEHGKVLELKNSKGAPLVRLAGIGNVKAGDLGASPTVTLNYQTDAWDGRWEVVLMAFHQPTDGRTFDFATGTLKAGGGDDRLKADGQWHTATATLKLTAQGQSVPADAMVPLYLMLKPSKDGKLPHTTLVDDIVITGGDGAGGEGAAASGGGGSGEQGISATVAWGEVTQKTYGPTSGPTVSVAAGDDLQKAIDRAQPGTTLELAAGTYPLPLTVETPGLTLRAAEPGSVTLSNVAETPLNWQPADGTEGLFVAAVPYPVRWVTADGRNLLGYDQPEGLRKFQRLGRETKDNVGANPEGFTWEDGKLYVRLFEAQDPRQAEVKVHRDLDDLKPDKKNREWWPTEWSHTADLGAFLSKQPGVGVVIAADGVTLEGLRIEMAPVTGVAVKADGATIRDCEISATRWGIASGASADLTVEHSSFSGYPAYEWVRWGQSQKPEVNTRDAMQTSNLETCFVQHAGPRAVIRHNVAWQAYDAMHPRDLVGGDDADPARVRSESAYNLILGSADEHYEFDSKEPLHLRVHHNVMADALVSLAFSPVLGGDLKVDHNLVYNSPEHGLAKSALLKFDCPWGFRQDGRSPTRDLTIVHNTLINAHLFLYWTGDDHLFEKIVFDDNLVDVVLANEWKLTGFEPGPGNVLRVMKGKHRGNVGLPNSHFLGDDEVGYAAPPPYGTGMMPVLVPLDTGGDGNGAPLDPRLAPGSAAVDATGDGSPAGAFDVASGSDGSGRWLPLRVGPRWDTEAAWQQTLPPSLREAVEPAAGGTAIAPREPR